MPRFAFWITQGSLWQPWLSAVVQHFGFGPCRKVEWDAPWQWGVGNSLSSLFVDIWYELLCFFFRLRAVLARCFKRKTIKHTHNTYIDYTAIFPWRCLVSEIWRYRIGKIGAVFGMFGNTFFLRIGEWRWPDPIKNSWKKDLFSSESIRLQGNWSVTLSLSLSTYIYALQGAKSIYPTKREVRKIIDSKVPAAE